jgi:hypothetical protein
MSSDYRMMPNDLPKAFWSYLGIDTSGIEKIVITIELGKPVLVEVRQTLSFPISDGGVAVNNMPDKGYRDWAPVN